MRAIKEREAFYKEGPYVAPDSPTRGPRSTYDLPGAERMTPND